MSPITVTNVGDGIALLEMRDEAGGNAMSVAFVARLLAKLHELAKRADVKVVVLLGLPEVFCSGASRDVLESVVDGLIEPDDLHVAEAVLDLPVPVVAAMEGHAIGGGLALGLCADIVLMARESRYGCPFLTMGFTPGMGMTGLLGQVLTPAVAHELLYTGELVRGRQLEGRSGVNHILPRAEIRPRALEIAARIAEKPRRALVTLKRALSLPRRRTFEATRTIETLMHDVTFAGPEVRQLVEEYFRDQ